ncbi:MAG: hypothetical protein FE78DRAFT_156583 [Acidomyces sp. 'richmondensis']|nr:MAG: hypothetical protein FE78DRAFT_156583 [Acidomyces sp. 'richmondensis']
MSAKLVTNVDERALKKTKFPPEFSHKVDVQKINLPVIQKWISDELAKILNTEDDVLTTTVCNYLEESRYPNIKQIQQNLSGFLDADAPRFSLELWKLCLSAQASPQGIPKELLEAKKAELLQERVGFTVQTVS